MSQSRTPPTLTLDIVQPLSITGPPEVNYFHIYGIFLQEDLAPNFSCWLLSDETCIRGVKFRLCGDLAQFPKPKPGDVVRIHRCSWDLISRMPVVMAPKNIVVWPAFAYNPTAISVAKNPTFTDEDTQRRRVLETFYCSNFDKIGDIKPMPQHNSNFFKIAGRVVATDGDVYGNCLITVQDETGKILVRIFNKQQNHEIKDHFEIASRLELGELVAITFAKLDNKGDRLNLSANSSMGRSIRPVAKDSILGVLLCQSLPPMELPQQDPPQLLPSSQPASQEINITTCAPVVLRRSPRLNKQSQPGQVPDVSLTIDQSIPNVASRKQSPGQEQQQVATNEEQLPGYTRVADISKTSFESYNFYNIAGQVRGRPIESNFQTWVFQLYDGSKVDFGSYFVDEVKEPLPDCVTVRVYSAQRPNDTNQHVDVVKQLDEGDLVFIKNVKASWKYGKLKLELSANLVHGKSISIIDKETRFGLRLLEIVTNPFADDLVDDQLYSTPPATPEHEFE